MAGTNIGTAYVQILPSTQGIGSGIAAALRGAGTAGGNELAGAMQTGIGLAGAKIAGLINPATLAALGIGKIGQASVQTGQEFDASMSHVYQLMASMNDGAGLTEAQMGKLRDRAREMGATTQFTASEVAEGMGYMALAGWKVDEVYENIPDVLNLAAASQMDLGRASDIVTDYMTAFSKTAPEAAQMADVLAYAQANSNATTDQFAESWHYTGQSMNMAGQSIETTTALLARMADQGTKGSTAGTQLNAMFTSLVKAMDKNGNVAINGQTVALADAEGHWRNMIDVIGDVQTAMSGLDETSPEYAAALMGTFGNVRSMRGIASLLNGDTEAMKAFENELQNAGGAAQQQAKIVNDNLAGDLKILKSATDEAGIAISDLLTPALRTGAQAATGFMQNLGLLLSGKGAEGAATQSISEIAQGFDKLSDVDYETTGRRIDGMIQKLSDANISEEDKAALRTALQEILQSVENTDDTTEAGKNAMEGVADGMLHYDFSESEGTIKENIVSAINDALQAHSPAQALVPSGENAAAGIMNGLTGYDYASGTAAATQAIVSAINANFAAGKWDGAGAAVSQGIGTGISSRKSAVTSAVGTVITAAKNKAGSEVGSGGANFKKYGTDISAGIAAGITGNKNKISDALVAAFDDAIQKLRRDLGLHSPSRLFADVIGKNVSLGIAKGITDYASSIDEALGAAMLPAGGYGLAYNPEFAGQGGGFTQNITVNSPKALTPAEIARQTRNATRQMVLDLGR